MSKTTLLTIAILGLVTVIVVLSNVAAASAVRIAIVTDGHWDENKTIRSLFESEIITLAEDEFDVEFVDIDRCEADWTLEGIQEILDDMFSDASVDIVVTLGAISSHVVCLMTDIPKPVVAAAVIDATFQQLPESNGTSGIKNLNYLTFPDNTTRDIAVFSEIVPFEHLAVISNKRFLDAIPNIRAHLGPEMTEMGIRRTFVPVDTSIDEAWDQMPPNVDAVYVVPLHHLPAGELERLADGLIERKLPSFSLWGLSDVEAGILATINHDIIPRLARATALNIQRVMLGEDPGTLPVAYTPGEKLVVNMATARAINVYPPWSVLTEAELLNAQRENIDRVISIEDAAREAINVNLDLSARSKFVSAGAKDVDVARSFLLPQVDLSMLGVQIDQDRAERSFGTQPEKTLSGSASLTQVIYADDAWANHTIQKRLQESRENDYEALRLDIAQDAATAYLDVLRASTLERIQLENLKRTRLNLELARVRESIGVARTAEILRWESELANNRRAVIEANATRNIMEINLNRILRRPAEEHFMTVDVDINDPALLLSREQMTRYMSNPWDFKLLRQFLVREGIAQSPEVRALDASIAAQERLAKTKSRSFWLPSFALQGDLSYLFWKDGAGSEPSGIIPGVSEPEDLSWSLGLVADYPLFVGGARFAERGQALDTLTELRIARQSSVDKLEQRIRSALHVAGASFAGIQQTRIAADAAVRSLDLVEDAYSRGAVSILDLLDAQNNAFVNAFNEADAVYKFLIDLMEVERSVGNLVLLMTVEERKSFYERMDNYFAYARESGE